MTTRQETTRQEKKGREVPTLDEFAEAIKAAMPTLDATDQRIASTIHRLMSVGDPVEPAAVATALGLSADQVNEKLNSWPGVYRDDQGRLVGFWGHAIEKLDPEYRLLADGKTTYAWCALDTLFIPPLVGKPIRVESSDPISGEPVSLVVERDAVRDVQPAGALVSMVVPDGPFGYDVIESFCHRVLFFATQASGDKWTAEHEGTTLLSVADAFELGRNMTDRIAPNLLSSGLEPLFEAELRYTSGSPADAVIPPEGREGDYLGSGDGTITGETLQGTIRWSFYSANCA